MCQKLATKQQGGPQPSPPAGRQPKLHLNATSGVFDFLLNSRQWEPQGAGVGKTRSKLRAGTDHALAVSNVLRRSCRAETQNHYLEMSKVGSDADCIREGDEDTGGAVGIGRGLGTVGGEA